MPSSRALQVMKLPLQQIDSCLLLWFSLPLLEGLCSINPCRFDFSGFVEGFAGTEPTTLGLTVPRSDEL